MTLEASVRGRGSGPTAGRGDRQPALGQISRALLSEAEPGHRAVDAQDGSGGRQREGQRHDRALVRAIECPLPHADEGNR